MQFPLLTQNHSEEYHATSFPQPMWIQALQVGLVLALNIDEDQELWAAFLGWEQEEVKVVVPHISPWQDVVTQGYLGYAQVHKPTTAVANRFNREF